MSGKPSCAVSTSLWAAAASAGGGSMLILVNRPGLMGEYRNSMWGNLVAGGTSVVMVLLTLALIWNSIRG